MNKQTGKECEHTLICCSLCSMLSCDCPKTADCYSHFKNCSSYQLPTMKDYSIGIDIAIKDKGDNE